MSALVLCAALLAADAQPVAQVFIEKQVVIGRELQKKLGPKGLAKVRQDLLGAGLIEVTPNALYREKPKPLADHVIELDGRRVPIDAQGFVHLERAPQQRHSCKLYRRMDDAAPFATLPLLEVFAPGEKPRPSTVLVEVPAPSK